MSDNNGVNKEDILNFDKLPGEVKISTMTITCKLGTNINLENVAKYIDLNMNGILSIRCGHKLECSRTLVELKKSKNKNKNKNKKKNNFYNQATMLIRHSDNKEINVKLFKNGSVQMTGCKSIENAKEVVGILMKELLVEKAILVNGEIIEKKYVDNVDNIKISDFKVVMINSNFKVNYSIDRETLYKILINEDIICTYEPCIHACVNIKFNCKFDGKVISIFVFQSGAIIITGANNVIHIISAYNFIIDKLKINHDKIVKKQLGTLLKNNKYLDDYLKANSLVFTPLKKENNTQSIL